MSFKSKTLKLLIMRKFALIAIILSLMVSCQKKQKSETESLMKTQGDSICIGLTDYSRLTTVAEQVEWLTEYGEIVCKDSLSEGIINIHKIDSKKIQSQHTVAYSRKWKTIRKFVGLNFYNAYLGFDFNGSSDVIAIKLVPNFEPTVSTYSIPFINAIAEYDNLTDDSTIEFRTGMINSTQVLLVITKDESNNIINYYDASGNPI